MTPIQTIASVIGGSGVLTLLLALPLIFRRVPPNLLYGIRIRAAFASESEWYRINAIGGRYLAISSVFITLAGVVGLFLPQSAFIPYATIAGTVTLVSVLVPAIRLCFIRPQGPN